jgi:hypothetical protein
MPLLGAYPASSSNCFPINKRLLPIYSSIPKGLEEAANSLTLQLDNQGTPSLDDFTADSFSFLKKEGKGSR